MRRIGMALAAVALVAAVAGCGSSDEGQSNKSASPKPSKLDVSGIVVLDTTPGNSDSFSDDKSWQVMVFDPESGKQKLNLGLPVNAAVNDDTGFYRSEHPAAEARRSFSSDWQYAAYAKKNGAIEILHLDATSQRYVPQTTIKRPSGSYSGGKVTYRHPTFSPNGHRLWFSASPSEGKSKLMSVDYTSPGKPRDEGTLRTEGVYTKSWRLTADGTPIEESSGWRVVDGSGEAGKANTSDGDQVSYVMKDGQVVGGDLIADDTTYQFVGAVDDREMLLFALQDLNNNDSDPVLTVHVDPESDKARVTTVAKAGAEPVTGVALAPDKKRVLIATFGDYFIKKLGTSADPKPLRKAVGVDEGSTEQPYVLGWTK